MLFGGRIGVQTHNFYTHTLYKINLYKLCYSLELKLTYYGIDVINLYKIAHNIKEEENKLFQLSLDSRNLKTSVLQLHPLTHNIFVGVAERIHVSQICLPLSHSFMGGCFFHDAY